MSYSSEVLADTPAAYYRLDESSGTNCADSSGNGHDLTYGGTFTLGQAGLLTGDADTAVLFSGGGGYARGFSTIPDPGTGDFAVEYWIETSNSAGAYVVNADSGQVQFRIDSGKMSCQFSSEGVLRSSVASIDDGTRHHCVITRDAGSLKYYIDGALDTNFGAVPVSVVFGASLDFLVGAYDTTPLAPVLGTLDEVALYDHALSAARVAAHYAAGSGGGGGAPTVASANVNAAGTTLTINFNVPGTSPMLPASGATGFTLTASGGAVTLSAPAISGTAYTATTSRTILSGETITLAYAPGNVTDSAGTPNALASFSGTSVTNNSTQTALASGTATTTTDTATSVSVSIATNSGGTAPYTNQLQRSPRGAGTWADIGSPVAGATATLTDGTVAASTAYDFRVHVTDAASGSSYSNTLNVTTPAPGPITVHQSLTYWEASFNFDEDQYSDSGTYGVGAPSKPLVISGGSTVNLTAGAAIVGPAPASIDAPPALFDYYPGLPGRALLCGILVSGSGSTLNASAGTVSGSSVGSSSVGLGQTAVIVAGGNATFSGGTFRGGDGEYPGSGLRQIMVIDSAGTPADSGFNYLAGPCGASTWIGTVTITGGTFRGGDAPRPVRAIWETGVGAVFQGNTTIAGGRFTPGANTIFAIHYRGVYGVSTTLTISGGVYEGHIALHTTGGTARIQGSGLVWTPGSPTAEWSSGLPTWSDDSGQVGPIGVVDEWSTGTLTGTLTSGDPINNLVVYPPGITVTATSSLITFGPSGLTRAAWSGPRSL